MADLFTLPELASYLQQDLDTSTAEVARRRASGWLRSATKLTEWPAVITDDLWGWALDLAVMAYQNPEWAQSVTVGGVTTNWGDLSTRRDEILAAAGALYNTAGVPGGYFPAPLGWPDPACSYSYSALTD